MAKEKAPAFQFYPNDWLSSSTVACMTNEQRGCYMMLLCYCWRDGALPDDDEMLASLARLPIERWQAIKGGVLRALTLTEDGWVNERLEAERLKQQAFRHKSSEAGKASARTRRSSVGATKREPSPNQIATKREPNPNQIATNCEPRGNQTSTEAQPKPNSSVFCLQSSTSVEDPPTPRATIDPHLAAMPRTAFARTGSRRGRQAFEWRACVPEALHVEFRRKLGGDEGEADESLRVWYRTVADAWPEGQVIGDTDWDFWRSRFREWRGATQAKTARASAAPMPDYDRDWCRHNPPCNSRDWHGVLVSREQSAEVA